MRVQVEKFGDGRSLKVLVQFEDASNFRIENNTWVPRIDEVEHIREVLSAIDEYNKVKKSMAGKW